MNRGHKKDVEDESVDLSEEDKEHEEHEEPESHRKMVKTLDILRQGVQ